VILETPGLFITVAKGLATIKEKKSLTKVDRRLEKLGLD